MAYNEITPAMLDAGLEAFWMFERDYSPCSEIVTAVYEAMALVARQSPVPLPLTAAEKARVRAVALARIAEWDADKRQRAKR